MKPEIPATLRIRFGLLAALSGGCAFDSPIVSDPNAPPPYRLVVQSVLLVDSAVQTLYVEQVHRLTDDPDDMIPVGGPVTVAVSDSAGVEVAVFARSPDTLAAFRAAWVVQPDTRYTVRILTEDDTAIAYVRTPPRPSISIPRATADTLPTEDSLLVFVGPAHAPVHVSFLRPVPDDPALDSASQQQPGSLNGLIGRMASVGADTTIWFSTRVISAGVVSLRRIQMVIGNVDGELSARLGGPRLPPNENVLHGAYGSIGSAALESRYYVVRPPVDSS